MVFCVRPPHARPSFAWEPPAIAIAFWRRPRMSIDAITNTLLCDPSTPICVESVLEPRSPAWYRRQMARKKVAEISGASIRAAREKLGLSQSELAARIKGIDQQDVSRAELEGVKGGDRKAKIARCLGLQRHNVSDTT